MKKNKYGPSLLPVVFCLLTILLVIAFAGCKPAANDKDEEGTAEKEVEARTPVNITRISTEAVSETLELNASSLFLKKYPVKANAVGYIENITVNIGDEVSADQLLFTIKTKEASAFESPDLIRDSTLKFSGLIKIRAQKNGVISTLNHQKGDYVQDGDQLGIISESSSLVFLLDVPFELHPYVKLNSQCAILLPDSTEIAGQITSVLPDMDAVSQTQSFVVKPRTEKKLPENLISKIRIFKNTKPNARVLPKAALLSNETQTDFWVMKLLNDSTAVKIQVTKGMETKNKIEILKPAFSDSDRILLNGQYGLGDTAKVLIQ